MRDETDKPTPNPLPLLEARPRRHQGCTPKGDTEEEEQEPVKMPGGLYSDPVEDMTPVS